MPFERPSLDERVAAIEFFPWSPSATNYCQHPWRKKVRDDLIRRSALPDGYGIQWDRRTHNFIVYGPELAFCITPYAIRDGLIETDYLPVLHRLFDAHSERDLHK